MPRGGYCTALHEGGTKDQCTETVCSRNSENGLGKDLVYEGEELTMAEGPKLLLCLGHLQRRQSSACPFCGGEAQVPLEQKLRWGMCDPSKVAGLELPCQRQWVVGVVVPQQLKEGGEHIFSFL